MLAAPASGSGKTTLTLGLLRAARRAGRAVASAKAGPDFIDPAFHAAASGRPCLNLDSWAMRPASIAAALDRLGADGAAILCEGVMGLFDGAGPRGYGSTAELAARLGWPVVLVVDAGGQAASAAVTVQGFAAHRPDVDVAGVVYNRVGGAAHGRLLAEASARIVPQVAVLGAVPRRAGLALPERHLGLVQAREHPELERFLDAAAEAVAAHVDVDRLLGLARPVRDRIDDGPEAPGPLPPLGARVAVACDAAFDFAYPAVLDGWRAAGAEVERFSPLADEAPAADADAVFLPGGYPELHAARIAGCARFLDGLRAAATRGASVYGECGGYMVLGDGLVDAEGRRHAMAGLLPLETSFAEPRTQLGYRALTLVADGPLGAAGTRYRGHEFHKSWAVREGPAEPLFEVADALGAPRGRAGLRRGPVAGSYMHLIDRA